jgi:glutaredoxin 3
MSDGFMPKVEIYSRRLCGYCSMAKRLLEDYQIPYVEYDATGNADLRAEMIQRAGGAYTFPQIFVDDRHVGGASELYRWEREGGLKRLVDAAKDSGSEAPGAQQEGEGK